MFLEILAFKGHMYRIPDTFVSILDELIDEFYPRCHNIHLNGTGKGDCSSLWNGTPWCYIIGEDSGCKDKAKSSRNEEFEVIPISPDYRKDIFYSEDACTGNDLLPENFGLEDFLPGYELLGVALPNK